MSLVVLVALLFYHCCVLSRLENSGVTISVQHAEVDTTLLLHYNNVHKGGSITLISRKENQKDHAYNRAHYFPAEK